MDNIANMLTIIRNAQAVKHETVKTPYSKVNFGIAEILKKGGWLKDVELKKKGEKSWLIIHLAYNKEGSSIASIQRISKPGKRVYVGYDKIPRINQGYGAAILSTPAGIMTGKEAKKLKIGGELLCKVY